MGGQGPQRSVASKKPLSKELTASNESSSTQNSHHHQGSKGTSCGVGTGLSGHTADAILSNACFASGTRCTSAGLCSNSLLLNLSSVLSQNLLGSCLLFCSRLFVHAGLVLDVGLAVLVEVPHHATDNESCRQNDACDSADVRALLFWVFARAVALAFTRLVAGAVALAFTRLFLSSGFLGSSILTRGFFGGLLSGLNLGGFFRGLSKCGRGNCENHSAGDGSCGQGLSKTLHGMFSFERSNREITTAASV